MAGRIILIVSLFPWLTFLLSCKSEIPVREPADDQLPVIEETIRAAIGWAKAKDFDLLYSVISNDSGYLEISPADRITRGFKQFRENEAFWRSPDFRAVGYEIRDLVIDISDKGDAAWFFCFLDDMNEWKGQPLNWMNTRWTGVLEKREGRWVIVQMHFSFPQQ